MDRDLKRLIELAKICPLDDPEWDKHLNNLVIATCKYPPESPERRKGTNEIIRIIQKSGKILRKDKSASYYEDALQATWFYFFPINFCKYQPRANFMAWFNTTLKYEIKRLEREKYKEDKKREHERHNEEDEIINPIDKLPSLPDSMPILECWERLKEWINEDPEGILKSCHIRDNTNANCQKLTQCILLEGKTLKATSQEVNSNISAIEARYRNCRTLLRKWLETEECIEISRMLYDPHAE